jgi:hypothetical protein
MSGEVVASPGRWAWPGRIIRRRASAAAGTRGREPGQQPPPAKCDRLVGRVPVGAFILYNGQGWDTRYDWPEHERRNRGSVPPAILDVMRSLSR